MSTTSVTTPGSAGVDAAHRAVLVIFALNGIAFATWASRIPDVKIGLVLTPGELGLTLLFASLGSLVGLPASGWVTDRYGAARTVVGGLTVLVAGLLTVGLGTSVLGSRWVVAAALFALGLGNGLCDVGMNLEGASVERLLGRTTMPRYHAAFSGGTVLSAVLGAGMSWARVPVVAHFALVALVILLVCGRFARAFLPRRLEEERGDEGGRSRALRAWREPRTLLIGLVVLVAAFTEGTANDWISVAFVEGYGLPPWAGVLAFATFLGLMTTGRVLGTHLLDRWGRVPVLRVMLVCAGAGSVLVVTGPVPLAYVGAAVWGVGTSLGFPVGMSAAADEPDRAPARISVVATIGYAAFLGGPPLLGFLGDHVGVLRALLAVGSLLVVALVALPAVRPPAQSAPAGAR